MKWRAFEMKRLLSTLLIGIMLLTFAPSAFAKQDGKRTSELAHEAKSAVLIERDTGKVLYNKNSNERLAACKHDENYDDAFDYGSFR